MTTSATSFTAVPTLTRSSASITGASTAGGAICLAAGRSTPIIARAIACVGSPSSARAPSSCAARCVEPSANVATVRPARKTVTASATARTSSSLCVTSTIAVPLCASWRSVASSPSTSTGASTAVGSSSRSSVAPPWSAEPRSRPAARRRASSVVGARPRIDRRARSSLAERVSARSRRRREVEPARRLHGFDAEHGVLDDAERTGERAVLLDDPDARRARRHAVPRAGVRSRAAIELRASPPSARTTPAMQLHERALASAILADERVHGAATRRRAVAPRSTGTLPGTALSSRARSSSDHCERHLDARPRRSRSASLRGRAARRRAAAAVRLRSSATKPTPCSASPSSCTPPTKPVLGDRRP